jgi:hypothetical protein
MIGAAAQERRQEICSATLFQLKAFIDRQTGEGTLAVMIHESSGRETSEVSGIQLE